MDRRLKWALGAVVLAGHAALLQALESAWQTPTRLVAMATPMFTRELKAAAPLARLAPSAPPTPVKVAQSAKPYRQANSELLATEKDAKQMPLVPDSPPVELAAVPVEPSPPELPPPEPTQSAAQTPTLAVTAAASQPAAPQVEPTPEPADTWPLDTRLSYVLTGNFRGPIGGDAQVQWQRVGARYQVQVDLGLSGLSFVKFSMTSQGQVTPQGLLPLAFEEKTTGRQTLKLGFDSGRVHLNDGRTIERPAGVQDTASQFVEFGHRFSSGQAVLEVGKSQQMWLARPNAAAQWTYDIVGQETLKSPRLGPIEAYHLKPRPLANPNGPITAELWFAPSLQYLPVRIRINLNTDTWVDLMIDKIEQASAPRPLAGGSAPGQAVVGPTETKVMP
jgi:hypothetical protein